MRGTRPEEAKINRNIWIALALVAGAVLGVTAVAVNWGDSAPQAITDGTSTTALATTTPPTTATVPATTTTAASTTTAPISDAEVFKIGAIAAYEVVYGEPPEKMPNITADDLVELGIGTMDRMWASFDPDLDQCIQFGFVVSVFSDASDTQTGAESEALFWFSVGYFAGENEAATAFSVMADVC